jgi:hypothetical protein
MSQRDDLKLLFENAVGFGDVSLAPDVVLGLLAELDVSNNVGRALSETLESVCESRDALARAVEQMKVENEALRNGLRLARHWCTSALKAARVDSQPSELLDIACLLRHQASDIDAALGQGEQS